MNKDLFYTKIDQPSSLSAGDIDALSELVEQYPYFASARVLLAKALHSANDHRFDESLQQAAIFAGDRKVLYDLIMKDNLTRAIHNVETALADEEDEELESPEEVKEETYSDQREQAEEETSRDEKEEVEPPSAVSTDEVRSDSVEVDSLETEQEETKQEPVSEDSPEIESDQQEGIAESKAIFEEHPEETEPEATAIELSEKDQELAPEKAPRNYDELEQEILFEAINSSISLEVGEDARGRRGGVRDESAENSEGKETEPEVQELASQDLDEEKSEPEAVKAPKSFSDWIAQRARQIHYYEQVGLAKEKGEQQAKKSAVEEAKRTDSTSEGQAEKPREHDLIEKFIHAEPKITPKKVDMFSSENLAKMSIVEDETFVTETMAKIFARQGNIRKAKKAYKLLSLKYPEKSIYFANQIKKLEGKK